MSEWAPRFVVAAVATVAVLCAVVLLRSRGTDTIAAAPTTGPGMIERTAARPAGAAAAARRAVRPEFAREGGREQAAPPPPNPPLGPLREGSAGAEAERRPELDAAPAAERQLAQETIVRMPLAGRPGAAGIDSAASASGVAPSFAVEVEGQSGPVGARQEHNENVDFGVEPGAYFPPDAVLAYSGRGGLGVDEGTVMFWIQPVDWDGFTDGIYWFFLLRDPNTHEHHFGILKDQDSIRFSVVSEAGKQVNLFWPIGNWRRGEWHQIAVTWGNSLVNLYLDGTMVASDLLEGVPAVRADSPAYWGSTRGDNGAGGILAKMRIYPVILRDEDIFADWGSVPGR